LLDWSTPAEVFAKKSRMKVVNGAIKGATWLSKQKPGFYTMKDIFS